MYVYFQDVRHKSPEYIEDLIAQGYVLKDRIELKNVSKIQNILKSRKIPLKIVNNSELGDNYNENLFSSKTMFIFPRDMVPEQKRHKAFKMYRFKDPLKFSRDTLDTLLLGFAFHKNNIFFGTFRNELQRLHEFGIIDKFKVNIAEMAKKARVDDEKIIEYDSKRTEVLTWNHLYAGFYLWFGACVVSTLVFIGEKMCYIIYRLKNN